MALWPQQWLFLAEGCARHARSPSPNPHYESFFVRKRRKTLRAQIGAHTSVRKTRAAQIQAGGEARPCEGRARSVNRSPRSKVALVEIWTPDMLVEEK